MDKAQKMAAIKVALAEYADNLAAVQESEIPGGFDQLVKEALVTTLRDKFERIFDQPNEPFAVKTIALASKSKPAKKVAPKKNGRKK